MKTRLSRDEQVARNRELVLDAARRVFLSHGYASATLEAIAQEAGFSKGVVYSQFESKADLFLALLDARIDERARQNEALAARHDGADLVAALPELAISLRRAEPRWTQLVLEFRLHAARVPGLSERYAELHRRTVSRLAAVYALIHERAGTTPRYPPHVLAQLGLALGNGAFLELLSDPAGDYLPVADVMTELVLGAGSPGPDDGPRRQ
jgi:AcrR family transcriptional regulator